MIKPKIKQINGINIEKYKTHPRILELRVIILFNLISKHYDYNIAIDFFQSLSKLFRCNWQLMNGIINNVFRIRELEKRDKTRFRQEVIFMGVLFNESRYKIVKDYLSVSLPVVYGKDFHLDNYVTQEWLDNLDNNIAICGIPHYKLEAERFVESYEGFLEVMGRVSIPKT
jgi:hypothetical protein